jgi:2'-hydroxyisoflavone reductase
VALLFVFLIVRPIFLFGPNDHTKRFPVWVQRIAAGGVIDCPKPVENPFQYIDARDQATFVVDLVERGVIGAFNSCVSPEITFGELLESILRAVAPPGTVLNWVEVNSDDEKANKYPLWSGRTASSMMTMASASAVENGLRFRPLSETISDTAKWLASKDPR